jgi:Tfp pilus assembly protein PilO
MLSGRWDRQRVILTAVFLGIEILLFGYLIFYTNRVKAARSQELAQAEQELATLRNDAGQLTDLRKQYGESKKLIAHLEPGLAPDRHQTYLPTLLSQLQDLADETHVSLQTYNPQVNKTAKPSTSSSSTTPSSGGTAATTAPAQETVSIIVRMVGTFPHLMDFINRLKTFPKVVNIDTIQLRPQQSGQNNFSTVSPELTVDMNLTATVLPLLPGVEP